MSAFVYNRKCHRLVTLRNIAANRLKAVVSDISGAFLAPAYDEADDLLAACTRSTG
jgi:hypothetical protein